MSNIIYGAKGQSKVLNHQIRTYKYSLKASKVSSVIGSIRRRGLTHVLRVAMRQRHSPSLVLLFLCLKLPNILSHMYCSNTANNMHFVVLVSER